MKGVGTMSDEEQQVPATEELDDEALDEAAGGSLGDYSKPPVRL